MPDEPKTEEPKEETPKEPITTEPVKEEPEETGDPQKPTDWEKRYKDLQTTYNKRDKEVSTLKTDSENYQKLKTFIEGDAEVYDYIKNKLTPQQPSPTSNGEATDSTKRTLGQTIIRDFEDRYGINNLEPEKANTIRKAIAGELADKYNPENKEAHVLDFVPIEKLENDLEKAYRYATMDDNNERARLKTLIDARQNQEGTFGSLASSGASSKEITLTPEQRETARKLGVSEEAYAKQLQKIQEGN